jgi:2,3-bisphosphoglycerate-independent phosphoglycerate mutase
MKKILIILDGASDLPVKILGEKTPFEAAETPNLNWFSKNGKLGYMYPINEKTAPGSDNSLISIFGNNPKECKRGIYEAVGLGIKLKKGDLALRINFGTIDNLKNKKVIDRRAGRTLTSKEAKILVNDINKKINIHCNFELKSSVQHRGVLILRGGFSDNISNTDPEWTGTHTDGFFKFSQPLNDDENSKYSANLLNNFLTQSFKLLSEHKINKERIKKGLLPANFLFTRGGGNEIIRLKKYKTWMSINPMPLEKGISELSGMKVFSFEYPELRNMDSYANLYEGLNNSIKFAIKTLKKQHKYYSGAYIQFKETDIPGHDNKPYEKKKMIEIIDKKIFGFLRKFIEKKYMEIVITCDHSTPCKMKRHSHHPVPVLVFDGKNSDKIEGFNEKNSKKGSLGKIYGKDFMIKTGLNK